MGEVRLVRNLNTNEYLTANINRILNTNLKTRTLVFRFFLSKTKNTPGAQRNSLELVTPSRQGYTKENYMNTKNDYHFRPQTNGQSRHRQSGASFHLSSSLAEGWAFHPGGDSIGAAMGRGHPSIDPCRRVKGHTQLLHQLSLTVSAVVHWTGRLLPHTAFVLTAQLNRDRFQGYGRQERQNVVL